MAKVAAHQLHRLWIVAVGVAQSMEQQTGIRV